MTLRSLFRREGAVDGDARLEQLRYVVFDTEFTALESKSNRLLSVGAVAMDGAKIRIGEQFYRMTNPGVEVPGKSVVVHKLRAEDVANAEDPRLVLQAFMTFCDGAVLVGHFVHYDIDIISRELQRIGAEWNPPVVDTAHVHRWSEMHGADHPAEGFDERTIRLDLASVAEHNGVVFDDAHDALADAFATAQVWQKQLSMLASRGRRSWRQLRAVR